MSISAGPCKRRHHRPIWAKLPKGVRRIGKNHYQLRVWFGGHKNAHYNFGQFPSEYTARKAGEKALALKKQGFGYLDVLIRLKASGVLPATLLPRWVYEVGDGTFGARCRWPGGSIELRPFATPEAAHRAMSEKLEARRKEGEVPVGFR